jgi:hypothetical protein
VAPATARPAAIDISRLKPASDGSRAGFRAPSCHLKMAGAAPESFAYGQLSCQRPEGIAWGLVGESLVRTDGVVAIGGGG